MRRTRPPFSTALFRVPVVACLSVLLAALLSGCAVKGQDALDTLTPLSDLDQSRQAAAQKARRRFGIISQNAATQAGPFRVNATLHYAGDEGTQRVSAYLWGNGGMDDPYPLRLDIQAGMGNTMAAVREDARLFTAYVPGDETVYLAPADSGDSMQAFGVPIPFTLFDMSLLFTGRYGEFFVGGPDAPSLLWAYGKKDAGTEKTTFFTLADDMRLPGLLERNPDGLPVSWTGAVSDEPSGWSVGLDYRDSSTRTTPYRVRFSHADGRKATVLVRDLAHTAPFSEEQLELSYPQETTKQILQ